MLKLNKSVILFIILFFATSVYAMKGAGHDGHDMSAKKMDHSSMTQSTKTPTGNFVHSSIADGVHGNFQIMSLASMNMKDPDGNTHHIMVSFSQNEKKMKHVVGSISAISPTGKKQTGVLKNFGGGMYAVNFIFEEAGEWDIICQFKDPSNDHTMNFRYPHQEM